MSDIKFFLNLTCKGKIKVKSTKLLLHFKTGEKKNLLIFKNYSNCLLQLNLLTINNGIRQCQFQNTLLIVFLYRIFRQVNFYKKMSSSQLKTFLILTISMIIYKFSLTPLITPYFRIMYWSSLKTSPSMHYQLIVIGYLLC